MYIKNIGGQNTVLPVLNELYSIENKIYNNCAQKVQNGNELRRLLRCISSIFQFQNENLKHRCEIKKINLVERRLKKKFYFFGSWVEKDTIFRDSLKYKDGCLQEWVRWQKKGPEVKCEFNYNSDHKLKELLYYVEEELFGRTHYNYSQDGKLRKEIRTAIKADIEEKVFYEYEDDEINVCIRNEEDQAIASCSYTVNENKLVEVELVPENMVKPIEISYSYDSEGKLSEGVCRIKDKMRSDRILYKYNNKGNRIKDVSLDEENNVRNLLRYDYDQNGNVMGETRFVKRENHVPQTGKLGYNRFEDQNKLCCSYEYDDRGNWVRKVIFSSSIHRGQLKYNPLLVEQRDITYQ